MQNASRAGNAARRERMEKIGNSRTLACSMMLNARRREQVRGVAAWSWVVGVPLVCGLGCGHSSDSGNSNGGTGGAGILCVPGIQVACSCTSGADGAQACKPDGSGFGACLCGSDAGGGSHGGMSGAGGGSATAGSMPAAGAAGESEAGAAGEGGAGGEVGALFGDANDFPKQAIVEDGVPANVPDLFAAASDSLTSPLCVLEPQLSSGRVPGAMFPSNWLRPRFRVAAANFDLYEIRLHSAAERNDLLV